jgi:hypothetical protein
MERVVAAHDALKLRKLADHAGREVRLAQQRRPVHDHGVDLEAARSAQLDDLRIFDATGKALPFALLPPDAPARVSARALPAAIFPVHTDDPAISHDNVEIRTSSGGSITAMSTRTSGGAKREVLSALVLDFGLDAARQPIDALVFTPPTAGNYEARVSLEVSDDLRHWDTLGYANLSWLSNDARQNLISNRMEFPARTFRYARVIWREGKPIRFAAVHAHAPVTQAAQAPHERITVQARRGRFAEDLVYEVAPAIPVERIGLSFAPGNVVMPAMLGHYQEQTPARGQLGSSWKFIPRLQATFYQFVQNGVERHAGEITLPGIHAAHWVLRPQAPPPSAPAMTVSWRPATLVFMASGNAPYTLHIGHAHAPPVRRSASDVAPGLTQAELRALEHATLGDVRVQARPVMPSPAQAGQKPPLSRKLVLWGVLLLGVAVLSAMAWKLAAQMKGGG